MLSIFNIFLYIFYVFIFIQIQVNLAKFSQIYANLGKLGKFRKIQENLAKFSQIQPILAKFTQIQPNLGKFKKSTNIIFKGIIYYQDVVSMVCNSKSYQDTWGTQVNFNKKIQLFLGIFILNRDKIYKKNISFIHILFKFQYKLQCYSCKFFIFCI